jgi:hypothetical protein
MFVCAWRPHFNMYLYASIWDDFFYLERWSVWMQTSYGYTPMQTSVYNSRYSRLARWLEELIRRQNARLVLAMAQHPRLGADSTLNCVELRDVLEMIVYHMY